MLIRLYQQKKNSYLEYKIGNKICFIKILPEVDDRIMAKFLTNCLFIGTEAEGPDRGILTLFVGTHFADPKRILEIAEEQKIKRIYFGAGNNRGITRNYLPLIKKIKNDYTVVIEIDSIQEIYTYPESFFPKVKIILTFDFSYASRIKYLKLVDEKVIRFYDRKIITALNDMLFKNDKEIK